MTFSLTLPCALVLQWSNLPLIVLDGHTMLALLSFYGKLDNVVVNNEIAYQRSI